MQKTIWVGSPIDLKTGEEATKALAKCNDNQYIINNTITKVPDERWRQAQKYERDTWMTYARNATSDRDQEHHTNFNKYTNLPYSLGSLIEIGCGPFTQTRTILTGRTASSITLVDPLIREYLKHPYCSYNRLSPQPVLIGCLAEELCDITYDTVICVNVLEHVRNAELVLQNLYNLLKVGGYIVFADRSYDNIDISMIYDVGHPIRIGRVSIDEFFTKFEKIFLNELQEEIGLAHYFIGVKHE